MALVDVLRSNGFLIATDAPYNCVGNGVADDWAGLQLLAEDATARQRPVYLPGNKTYRITKTLRMDTFQHRTANPADYIHRWFGGVESGVRPKILLAANATGFGSVSAPRPTVYFNNYQPTATFPYKNPRPPNRENQNPYTQNPTMTYNNVTYTWDPWAANLYYNIWYNIDIDTNQNAGADGLAFLCAQANLVGNMKITATGSNIGLRAGSGRASPCVNVEVVGGRYAATINHTQSGENTASSVYIGFKASGQTVAVFEQYNDFGPMQIIGFDITTNNIPVFNLTNDANRTSENVFILHDGVVREIGGAGSTPFRNPTGRTCYLRNIWVTGTNNLISHPTGTATGSGTWKRIREYSQNSMKINTAVNAASGQIASYHVIDGVIDRTAQPFAPSIESNASAPADMIAVHWPGNAEYFHEDMIVATDAPYNADRTGATDAVAAIEAAMLAAETAGHNRVFLPPGRYTLSRTLNLRKHTKLIGGGHSDFDYNLPYSSTRLLAASNWIPGGIEEPMVATPNDAAATCQINFLAIIKPSNASQAGKYTYYHNNLLWRSGRYSSTLACNLHKVWEPEAAVGQKLAEHINKIVSGNGGGRHYGYAAANGDQYSGALTRTLLIRGTTEPLFVYSCQYEITKGGLAAATNVEVNGAENVRLYGFKREGYSPSVMIVDSSNIAVYGSAAGRNKITNPAYFWVRGASNNILYAGHVTSAVKGAAFTGTYSQTGTTITLTRTGHRLTAGESIWLNFTSGLATDGVYEVQTASSTQFTVTSATSQSTSGNFEYWSRFDTLREEITGEDRVEIDYPMHVSYYRRGTIDDAAMEIPQPPVEPPTQSAVPSAPLVPPGENLDFTLTPPYEVPVSSTLDGISRAVSNATINGGRIVMPSKADMLTGDFKNTDWLTPIPLVISFATADPVTVQVVLTGPTPANQPLALNFWGKRPPEPVPGEEDSE